FGVCLNPVAELSITIGPDANATAITRGAIPKPSFSIKNGTSANIGVVTMTMIYGAISFSTFGRRVNTAASTIPIVEPIVNPTINVTTVVRRGSKYKVEKSFTRLSIIAEGLGKT